MKPRNPALDRVMIFLDRDGTINRNYQEGPVYRIELFELLPGAARAVRIFNEMGARTAVVTNQGGINHIGRDFDWETYGRIEKLMRELLEAEAGARVDDVFVCNHADYENCGCRKPEVGLLEKARGKYDFDPEKSYIIGDTGADIKAGKKFGLKTILVESGWDRTAAERLEKEGISPDHIFPDLLAAAEFLRELLR